MVFLKQQFVTEVGLKQVEHTKRGRKKVSFRSLMVIRGKWVKDKRRVLSKKNKRKKPRPIDLAWLNDMKNEMSKFVDWLL